MIAEERFERILEIIEEKRVVTVAELSETLNISESTIRRDLTSLNEGKKLKKVHGGATVLGRDLVAMDCDVQSREDHYREEKKRIGRFGASLIQKNDFVFVDAGTSTEAMADAITESGAIYVTNGISIAKSLVKKGFRTIIIGGEVKPVTEAVVGSEALGCIRKYHFTKGFFGSNGVDIHAGFTTPDPTEAKVKREAFLRSRVAYILADPSKFNQVAPVSFAAIGDGEIITTKLCCDAYRKHTKIWEVDEE